MKISVTGNEIRGSGSSVVPRVILAYPKIDHEKDYAYFWMPFSLLSIAKPLIDDAIADVVLFDGNQARPGDWEAFLDEHIDDAVCVGFSIMTGGGQIGHALEMARVVRERQPETPLVFGGPHVNVLGQQTLAHDLVDAVLLGPGQASMPAFVKALRGLSSWDEVPGLLTTNTGHIVRGPINPPRTGLLGGYPWQLLRVEDYVRDDPTIAPRTLNYISSQGCVYKCRFCYELTYQRKYSYMPSTSLVDDIERLVNTYNINGVKFYDADWFISRKRSLRFCRELVRRGLDIRWAASINPNDVRKARRFDRNMMEWVARSGCSRLLMGVESGSDRILRDVVEKEITRAQILDVAKEIASYGILGSYTFIVGFPGETPDEEDETYSLLDELRTLEPKPETRVHVFAPYPGTPLYLEAVKHGFEPPRSLEDWSRYDYYESQTPWTSVETVRRAREHTHMTLSASAARREAGLKSPGGGS